MTVDSRKNQDALKQINTMLEAEMGLSFPENRFPDLERGIRAACKTLGFSTADDCFSQLCDRELSREQVELLASHLTIGETYFFREPNSFKALEAKILPPLIEKRRRTTKILRFWSAGCSSGEEAYSISILLQRMVPDWRDWNITVLATDINPEALRKAQRGVYRPWSFRGSGATFKKTYFEPAQGHSLEIKPEVRELVRFSYLNLADTESYPSMATNTLAMDVIFCRNVLMYFSPGGVRAVGARLAESLTDGGLLVLSPSEASSHYFPQLEPVNMPGAVFFRKTAGYSRPEAFGILEEILKQRSDFPGESTPEPEDRPAPQPPPPAEPEEELAAYLAAARTHFERGEFFEAALVLRKYLRHKPDDREALDLQVRASANAGQLHEALQTCEVALALDRLDPAFHYLKANVEQEMGACGAAINTLRGALFVQPDFAMAHFLRGNLLRQEGRSQDARRHLKRAQILLEKLPPDTVPPEGENLTVGRLQQIITANLKALG